MESHDLRTQSTPHSRHGAPPAGQRAWSSVPGDCDMFRMAGSENGRMETMSHRVGNVSCGVAVIVALSAVPMQASAADLLRLSTAQRAAWDSAAPELGQSADTFDQHGITPDCL